MGYRQIPGCTHVQREEIPQRCEHQEVRIVGGSVTLGSVHPQVLVLRPRNPRVRKERNRWFTDGYSMGADPGTNVEVMEEVPLVQGSKME